MESEKQLDLYVLTLSEHQKLQFKHNFKIHTTFDKAKFVDKEVLSQLKRQFETNFSHHEHHNKRIREAKNNIAPEARRTGERIEVRVKLAKMNDEEIK